MFGIFNSVDDFVIRSPDAVNVDTITYGSEDGLMTTEVESRVLRGGNRAIGNRVSVRDLLASR